MHGRRTCKSASAWSWALTAAAAIAGCAGAQREPLGKPAAAEGGRTAVTTAPADYDPARAFLTLAQLDPAPATSASVEEKPLSSRGQAYLQEAEKLVAEERFTEATQALEKALRSDPAAAAVHQALAWAAYSAGNAERARGHAAEALRLNGDDPRSYYILGRAAFDEGDTRTAVRHFRTGLACTAIGSARGVAALADWYLAKSLAAEGYLTAALQSYAAFEAQVQRLTDVAEPPPAELATLLRLNPDSAAEPVALLHERLGQFAEAADALARVMASPRPGLDTRLRYARLLAAAGRFDEALTQARAAGELATDPDAVVALLADIRRQMRQPALVSDDVRALAQQRPDDRRWLLAYVGVLRSLEQSEAAEAALAGYVAAHPEATDVAWQLCDDYVRAGRRAPAVELAARLVLSRPQDYGEALVRLAAWSSDPQMCAAVLENQAAGSPAVRYLAGVLALRLKQTDRGKAWLGEVLAGMPDFAPARLALAEQYLTEYRWQDVVDLLQDRDRPDANFEWALGAAYDGQDAAEPAVQHYSAAVRLNRADTRSMFALAELYERTDAPLRAQRQYEAILDVNPLHEAAREALVGLLLSSRMFDEAEAQVRMLTKLAASPNCVARCEVRLQLARGGSDVEQAQRTLREALAQAGPDAESLTLLASLDLARDDAPAAEQELRVALAVVPDHLLAHELLVWSYRRQLRFEEAATELRTLLARHPRRTRWIKNLIDVLMIDQRYTDAASVAAAALRLEGLDARVVREFRLGLLEALEASGNVTERIAVLQRWLATGDADWDWRGRLVDAYRAAQQPAEAEAAAAGWYAADPADRQAADLYRRALVAGGKYEAAEQIALDALEEDPGNVNLQLALIEVLGQAQRFDAALELVESLLPTTPQTLGMLATELDLYRDAKRYADAAVLATRMLQDEGLARSVGPLGESYLRERLSAALIDALVSGERYEEAQAKLTRWIDQADTTADKFGYLRLLAGVNQQRGLAAEALESLELAYKLDPTDAGINNDLGYTLSEAGQRLDEAERMVRFAVAHEPRNAAYLDSLGWVLYRRGRFDEAQTWLRRAVGSPEAREDPVIYDHLGDACWRAGVPEAAAEHWKKAVELGEARLREREDTVSRRVVDAARGKQAAAANGQRPAVAPVAGE